jgi:hypothetical protein
MSELKQKILAGIELNGLDSIAYMKDYEPWTNEFKFVEINNVVIDELAEDILSEISQQPQLNDNQQIVVDWAKSYLSETKNIGWFIEELAFLPTTGGKMRYKEVAYVYESLSSQEKIGFLNAVIAWAQEQEGEHV